MEPHFIDAHAHCGRQHRPPPQAFQDYLARVKGTDIGGAVFFPPVMEIYDRDDPDFQDTPRWRERRRRANEYLLTLHSEAFRVYPYLFIWNDFAVDQLTPEHRGIKWHRHWDEPVYHYDSPQCRRAVEVIRERNLPVCLEEELGNTLRFIGEIAVGVRVVIPHLGMLNGGYEKLKELNVWANPNVFTDTSLASPDTVLDYLQHYGSERIMFGSDFPFGDPPEEMEKILRLPVSEALKEALLGRNAENLLATSNR